MNSDTPSAGDDFQDLLDALCDRQLTAGELQRFENRIKSDAAARWQYIAMASLCASIEWTEGSGRHADEKDPWMATCEANLESEIRNPKPLHPPVLGFLGRTGEILANPILWSILGAGLLFCGYFVAVSWDLRGRAPHDSRLTVAPPHEESIASGEPRQIESGVVELQLKQGTILLVHGPAAWSINGDNCATLNTGKLIAKVPPQAIGFTLDTPTARIVDLGTEFEATVAANHETDVRVVKGMIEAASREAPPGFSEPAIRLEAGEGARFSSGSSAITRLANSSLLTTTVSKKYEPSLGSDIVSRLRHDGAVGDVFICMERARVSGRAGEFTFFSDIPDRWVTPLLFALDKRGVYTLTGIGQSFQSDGSGEQHGPFTLVAGNDSIERGVHYLGLFDGHVSPDENLSVRIVSTNAGTVNYAENPGQVGPWIFATDYSAATASVKLDGKFAISGEPEQGIVDLSGIASDLDGRFYSAKLSIETSR